jgi:hypothetical protein
LYLSNGSWLVSITQSHLFLAANNETIQQSELKAKKLIALLDAMSETEEPLQALTTDIQRQEVILKQLQSMMKQAQKALSRLPKKDQHLDAMLQEANTDMSEANTALSDAKLIQEYKEKSLPEQKWTKRVNMANRRTQIRVKKAFKSTEKVYDMATDAELQLFESQLQPLINEVESAFQDSRQAIMTAHNLSDQVWEATKRSVMMYDQPGQQIQQVLAAAEQSKKIAQEKASVTDHKAHRLVIFASELTSKHKMSEKILQCIDRMSRRAKEIRHLTADRLKIALSASKPATFQDFQRALDQAEETKLSIDAYIHQSIAIGQKAITITKEWNPFQNRKEQVLRQIYFQIRKSDDQVVMAAKRGEAAMWSVLDMFKKMVDHTLVKQGKQARQLEEKLAHISTRLTKEYDVIFQKASTEESAKDLNQLFKMSKNLVKDLTETLNLAKIIIKPASHDQSESTHKAIQTAGKLIQKLSLLLRKAKSILRKVHQPSKISSVITKNYKVLQSKIKPAIESTFHATRDAVELSLKNMIHIRNAEEIRFKQDLESNILKIRQAEAHVHEKSKLSFIAGSKVLKMATYALLKDIQVQDAYEKSVKKFTKSVKKTQTATERLKFALEKLMDISKSVTEAAGKQKSLYKKAVQQAASLKFLSAKQHERLNSVLSLAKSAHKKATEAKIKMTQALETLNDAQKASVQSMGTQGESRAQSLVDNEKLNSQKAHEAAIHLEKISRAKSKEVLKVISTLRGELKQQQEQIEDKIRRLIQKKTKKLNQLHQATQSWIMELQTLSEPIKVKTLKRKVQKSIKKIRKWIKKLVLSISEMSKTIATTEEWTKKMNNMSKKWEKRVQVLYQRLNDESKQSVISESTTEIQQMAKKEMNPLTEELHLKKKQFTIPTEKALTLLLDDRFSFPYNEETIHLEDRDSEDDLAVDLDETVPSDLFHDEHLSNELVNDLTLDEDNQLKYTESFPNELSETPMNEDIKLHRDKNPNKDHDNHHLPAADIFASLNRRLERIRKPKRKRRHSDVLTSPI